MIALLTGALFLPTPAVFLIIPLLSSLMLWECYRMLAGGGFANFPVTGVVGGAVLILGTAAAYLFGCEPGTVATVEAVLLAGIIFAVFIRQMLQKQGAHPITQLAVTLFGIAYIPFFFNFYTKLLLEWSTPEMDGRHLLFYMILIVKVTDMSAYFTGCSIGKHKLIPRISPAKTWEGCIGGVLGGLLTSLIFWAVMNGQIGPVRFSVAHAILLGILLPVIGIAGDLIESLLKRAVDVKDSGQVLKGMGGIMDVLDSLLFAAPAFYLFIRLIQ